MSQQINLLNPALIERSELIGTNRILAIISVLFVGMFGYYFYEKSALTELKQQRAQAASRLETSQNNMNAFIANNKPKDDAILNEEISKLVQKEMEQEAMIKATTKTDQHQSQSYAALLRALSKQSINGLWITGLNIDQDAQNLSISGRTLDADLVPKFITRLRAEPALKGKTFTDLTMQVNVKKQAKKIAEPATKTVAQQNTTVAIKTEKEVVYAMPDYIEFTLKSVTDDSNNINDLAQAKQQTTAGVVN